MNLQVLCKKFFVSKQSQGCSPKTIEYYQYRLGTFDGWCQEQGYSDSDLVGLVGAETIEMFLAYRRGVPCSPHTVAGDYRALRVLYNWLDSRKISSGDNPFEFLTEPKTPRIAPKSIAEKDFEKLMSYLASRDIWSARRDECIFTMLGFCGLRLSEIVALKEKDIDLEHRLIRVFRFKTQSETFVPITEEIAEIFRCWIEVHRPESITCLWPKSTPGGRVINSPLTAEGLREMCKRRSNQAKLPRVWRPHSFRHKCGSGLAALGADAVLIQQVLGHTDIKSSLYYINYRTSDLVPALDRLYRQ